MTRGATALLAVAALTLGGCGDPAGDGAATATDSSPRAGSPAPAASSPSADTGAAPADLPDSLRFTVRTVDGQPFDNAALAGKPTVFWFWASWCPTCRAKAGDVADLHREKTGEINVIGVAGLYSGEPEMRKFVADAGIGAFPNISDDEGQLWRKFGVKSQDDYVILDRAGKVVHSGPMGDADLRKRVAELAA